MNSMKNESENTPKSSKSQKMVDLTENDQSDEDEEDEEKRTMFCGNLHPKITEALLYELCLQAGPLVKVHIPKPKDGPQKNFGFATYQYSCSVPYAIDILEGVTLFGQKVTFQYRNRNSRNGAEQERRKRMREDDNRHHQNYPSQDQLNLQHQQLAAAAQMGLIDQNYFMYITKTLGQNSFSPPQQSLMSNPMQMDLYKRPSQADRVRRRDERDVYHRPQNSNNNWGGRHGHNQRNDRRSEQRRSGGSGNYR